MEAVEAVKLKPCPTPWCHGEGEVRSYGGFQVICQGKNTLEGGNIGCGVEGPECATPEEAIAAWNTRAYEANPSEIEELREALRPFADFADPHGYVPDEHKITVGSELAKRQLTMADCRKARALLTRIAQPENRGGGECLRASS